MKLFTKSLLGSLGMMAAEFLTALRCGSEPLPDGAGLFALGLPASAHRTCHFVATVQPRYGVDSRTAWCRATTPKVMLRQATSAHPARAIRAARARWSGQAAIDSVRYV